MTDIKKTTKTKAGKKVKKLQLNKETLKDLNLAREKGHNVRGGNPRQCSLNATGC